MIDVPIPEDIVHNRCGEYWVWRLEFRAGRTCSLTQFKQVDIGDCDAGC